MKKQTFGTPFYIAFFIFGAFLGLALVFFATWGDLESAFYGFDHTGGEPFNTMHCPILMTATETSSFSVKVTNNTGQKINPSLIANISTPILIDTSTTRFPLEPGETKSMKWDIGPQNIDLERFILIRAWLHGGYPMPDKESTCGVYVLFLPGKGVYYTWSMIVLSLLGMGGSLFAMRKAPVSDRGGGTVGRFTVLAVIILLGMLVTYTGFWMGGVVTLVFAFLMIMISLGYAIKQ